MTVVCLLTVSRSSDEYQRTFFNEWGRSIQVMLPFCGYADMPRTSNRRILLYSKSTQGKCKGLIFERLSHLYVLLLFCSAMYFYCKRSLDGVEEDDMRLAEEERETDSEDDGRSGSYIWTRTLIHPISHKSYIFTSYDFPLKHLLVHPLYMDMISLYNVRS
ncbi:hypothetical protein GQ457_02G013220 [Hibiscus cannabinus]